VKLNLPRSPRKRNKVIRNLASEIGITPKNNQRRESNITEDVKKLVVQFFEREDIARWTPGRKESITIKVNGEKVTYQKRYLVCSLREVYSLFVETHGNILGLAKFCELRPPHIVTFGSTPAEACCCLEHKNFMK
jgi:hypothetical protein